MFDPNNLNSEENILFTNACDLTIAMVKHDYKVQLNSNYDINDAKKNIEFQKQILDCVKEIVALGNFTEDEIYNYLLDFGEIHRINMIVDDVTDDIPDDMIMDEGMTGAELKKQMREGMLRGI